MDFLKKVLFSIVLSVISFAVMAIDVNSASATEMAKELKGIGPAKAEAIVSYREQNGKFKELKDLLKIKGIGAATLDKNRDKIELL